LIINKIVPYPLRISVKKINLTSLGIVLDIRMTHYTFLNNLKLFTDDETSKTMLVDALFIGNNVIYGSM